MMAKPMKPLVDNHYRLERFPGKGGWTYARIPEIPQDKSNPFGWVRVRGAIDGLKFSNTHLMPMGNGMLFFPVKAEIRKKIAKKEGDTVHIVIFPDNEPLTVPKEMQLCLSDEPVAQKFFNTLSDSEKNYYIKWIFGARKIETKEARMIKAISRLKQGLKMHATKLTE
jgi:hypothetical protein